MHTPSLGIPHEEARTPASVPKLLPVFEVLRRHRALRLVIAQFRRSSLRKEKWRIRESGEKRFQSLTGFIILSLVFLARSCSSNLSERLNKKYSKMKARIEAPIPWNTKNTRCPESELRNFYLHVDSKLHVLYRHETLCCKQKYETEAM